MNDWKEVFRKFYNDNEAGGSSRWLVAPTTVEIFIEGLLMGKNIEKLTVYRQAKRLLGEIMDAKYGTKNRSLLILRLEELIQTLVDDEIKRGESLK